MLLRAYQVLEDYSLDCAIEFLFEIFEIHLRWEWLG